MKLKLTKISAIILSATFVLASCSKNSDIVSPVTINTQDILTFANSNEFNATLQKVSTMTADERHAWEKTKGFTSYGTICDDFYKTIVPQNFKSIDEINTFVANNSDKIEIYQNKEGDKYCEVRDFDNPARYLINANRMYIVGDSAIREFSKGIVSTNLANIDALSKAKSFSDLQSGSSASAIFKANPTTITGNSQSCEVYAESDQHDGWFGALQTYRLVVRFKAQSLPQYTTYTDPYTNVTFMYETGVKNTYLMQVSNYVWHGILFGVSRKTSYDISMKYIDTDGSTIPKNYSKTDTYFKESTPFYLDTNDKVNHKTDVHIIDFHAYAENDKKCKLDTLKIF